MQKKYIEYLISFLVLNVLPFFIFYWVTFLDQVLAMDYHQHATPQQMELLFSIKNGSFPLYAPGFCNGTSAYALTVGQLFHPITYIAQMIPGYWDGDAHRINIILRLVTFGITNFVLYLFLRRLNLNILFAFLISIFTIYNLRMLDLFRYAASESYTAHILLFVACACYFIKPRIVLHPVIIILLTYLLVVSGHAQFMYLALCGNILGVLLVPFFIPEILKEGLVDIKEKIKYCIRVFSFMFVGGLLASCYTVPFYFDFMLDNSERVGREWTWVIGYQSNLKDVINTFMSPFYSDVHGTFGSSSIILIVLLIPFIFKLYKNIPKIVMALWVILLTLMLLTTGSHTPLYFIFWKVFPLADTFRVPGRLATLIPIVLMLLLVWVFSRDKKVKINNHELPLYSFLALISLVLYVLYNLQPIDFITSNNDFMPAAFIDIKSKEVLKNFILGVLSLLFLFLYGAMKKGRLVIVSGLLIAVFFQIALTLTYGTWFIERPQTKTMSEMREEKKETLLGYLESGHYDRKAVTEHLKKAPIEKRLARITRKYELISSREEAYKNIIRARLNDILQVENFDMKNLFYFKKPDIGEIDKVELKYSSYNKVVFDAFAKSPGFFSFAYPYSKYWNAYVDGKKEKIYRGNGLEQVLWLTPGRHVIEFKYYSEMAIWGMLISTIVGLLIVAYLITMLIREKIFKLFCMLFAILISSYSFYFWMESFYSGENINTKYAWTNKLSNDAL